MLMQRELSSLVLVDVQEKLMPHVMNASSIVSRCEWLMRLSTSMQVPMLISEQYPSGLGKTVEALQAFPETSTPIEKTHFSCYQNDAFVARWEAYNKQQVILCGIETHVCVLQTALDFMTHTDVDVFVVVDAVGSRHEMDHKYGLKRMKQAGVTLVTTEMVFFEWVHRAGTSEFKTLSNTFLR